MSYILGRVARETDVLQQLSDLVLVQIQALLLRTEAQVFRHCARENERTLHHHADTSPQIARGNLAIISTFERDSAAGRLIEPIQQAQQRGFAGAARSYNAKQFAAVYLEADVIDDDFPVYGTGKILELEKTRQDRYSNLEENYER